MRASDDVSRVVARRRVAVAKLDLRDARAAADRPGDEIDQRTGLRKGSLKFSYLVLRTAASAPQEGRWRVDYKVQDQSGDGDVHGPIRERDFRRAAALKDHDEPESLQDGGDFAAGKAF